MLTIDQLTQLSSLEVSHLSDVHKLPVFVQHGPGLLRLVAQSDVSLQQGVQQLAEPLYCLNTHTRTDHHLIDTGSIALCVCLCVLSCLLPVKHLLHI